MLLCFVGHCKKLLYNYQSMPRKFIYVPQQCYAVITPETDKEVIAGLCTDGLNVCSGIVVNASRNRYIFLCHADDKVDLFDSRDGLPAWIRRVQSMEKMDRTMSIEIRYDDSDTASSERYERRIREIVEPFSQGGCRVVIEAVPPKKYDLYLLCIADTTRLPDLSRRTTDKLPVLVKKGTEIYVYGRKEEATLDYTLLDARKFTPIPFPTIAQAEVQLDKNKIPVEIYEEITSKGGHTPPRTLPGIVVFSDNGRTVRGGGIEFGLTGGEFSVEEGASAEKFNIENSPLRYFISDVIAAEQAGEKYTPICVFEAMHMLTPEKLIARYPQVSTVLFSNTDFLGEPSPDVGSIPFSR